MTLARVHRSRHLAAAVVTVGLVSTAVAVPALANEWSADDVHSPGAAFLGSIELPTGGPGLQLETATGFDPADLTVSIAPAERPADRVAVPFTAVDAMDGGVIDVDATRAALGEAGTGAVVYTVSADGKDLEGSLTFGPDADLGDDVSGPVIDATGRQDLSLSDVPMFAHEDVQMAPDATGMEISYPVDGVMFDDTLAWVTAEAEHGQAVVFRDRDQQSLRVWYVPEKGFTGTDSFEVEIHAGGIYHGLSVDVQVGQPLPAVTAGLPDAEDGVLGAQALDAEDPEVARTLAAFADLDGEDAEEPTSETPASEGSETATPDDEAEHTVPEKVQTGDAPVGWLAGAAALGVGALAVTRRRVLGA